VESNQRTKTVLVVDDEELILDFIKLTLKLSGYRVLIAANKNEALELCKAEEGAIDLALLDISLPGVTGSGLSQALHELMPYLPIVYMTGYADGDLARFGLTDSQLDLLLKPFVARQLTEKVRDVLARVNVLSAGSKKPGFRA
jgi:DNA-binding NtrC family response regulator